MAIPGLLGRARRRVATSRHAPNEHVPAAGLEGAKVHTGLVGGLCT